MTCNQLPGEKREEMIAAVKNYFQPERGEEAGDLAAGMITGFIQKKPAPEFYNKAEDDPHA